MKGGVGIKPYAHSEKNFNKPNKKVTKQTLLKKKLSKIKEMKKKMRPSAIYRPKLKFMSNGRPFKLHMMNKTNKKPAFGLKMADNGVVKMADSPISTMQMKTNGRPHSIYKLRKKICLNQIMGLIF